MNALTYRYEYLKDASTYNFRSAAEPWLGLGDKEGKQSVVEGYGLVR